MEAHQPCPALNVSSDNETLLMLTQLQISRLLSLFYLMPYCNGLKYSPSSLKGLPLFANIPFLPFPPQFLHHSPYSLCFLDYCHICQVSPRAPVWSQVLNSTCEQRPDPTCTEISAQ